MTITTGRPRTVRTALRGRALLNDSTLNKGTAFTAVERAALGLEGLLPPKVATLDEQARRSYAQYLKQPTDLARNIFLDGLHDRNEVLYHRLLADHLPELLSIVYTPTIGEAIEHYSQEYRRPRGLYLSIAQPDGIATALDNLGLGADDVDLLVCTDAEAILGIGDWGVNGVDISVGKLAVYIAAAGIDPHRAVAVVLDVGTDRTSLREDPAYLGLRRSRTRGAAYDDFVDAYVATVTTRFPSALVHFEDFGPENARAILGRHRDRACVFNDDVQGTGAVALATVLAAVRVSGVPLHEQRLVVLGAGTAGVGIADQVRDAMVRDGASPAEAAARVWLVDRDGLLTTDPAGGTGLRDFQIGYARDAAEVAGWRRESGAGIGLAEVVHRVHPTMLVGTSTAPGTFTEAIVRDMAANTARPVILPMSNPTRLAEAVPGDLLAWTDGRALVATGSPFPPVVHAGVEYDIGQANNALVFPGLGLGVRVARATRVTDAMLVAAAEAVAAQADADRQGAALLPAMADLRTTSAAVAERVVAAAVDGGVARHSPTNVAAAVSGAMWWPEYPSIEPYLSNSATRGPD